MTLKHMTVKGPDGLRSGHAIMALTQFLGAGLSCVSFCVIDLLRKSLEIVAKYQRVCHTEWVLFLFKSKFEMS